MSMIPELGVVNRRNVVHIIHTINTGAAGVIASQDELGDSGVLATKTPAKTGRYTLALPDQVRRFHGALALVHGPDDVVYGAKTKGSFSFTRVDSTASATAPTVLLQFVNPSTDATNYIDAELPDNSIVHVHMWVEY